MLKEGVIGKGWLRRNAESTKNGAQKMEQKKSLSSLRSLAAKDAWPRRNAESTKNGAEKISEFFAISCG